MDSGLASRNQKRRRSGRAPSSKPGETGLRNRGIEKWSLSKIASRKVRSHLATQSSLDRDSLIVLGPAKQFTPEAQGFAFKLRVFRPAGMERLSTSTSLATVEKIRPVVGGESAEHHNLATAGADGMAAYAQRSNDTRGRSSGKSQTLVQRPD